MNDSSSLEPIPIVSKEKRAEYNCRWRETHKEQFLEYHRAKILCTSCNKEIERKNMAAHRRSQLHQRNSAHFDQLTQVLKDEKAGDHDKIHPIKTIFQVVGDTSPLTPSQLI